ncbi:DUF2283 domain-containing protein [Methanobrevibacter filiformis]|uniref:DUF2283 domain-containing protein n=1 Tax=Methanobrevibacter filiformis TaxID=55758 RepID=A0A166FI29_9EURY|nr:DUF2283 domain-containing protein [Methanobrevibacter filiformis]KZX17695.1 hypothetical protein MBFIL_00100 [Methanobrevibacter filiformis]
MKNNKNFGYSYDVLSDAVTINPHNNREYYDTITLDKNIIIDIDKTGFPTVIEILDFSKILDIEKYLLEKSSLNNLQINKDGKNIIIRIIIEVSTPRLDEIKTSNNYSINKGLTELIIEENIK